MIHKGFLVFLLILNCISLYSERVIGNDSLENQLLSAKNPEERFVLLSKLVDQYTSSNVNKALQYANQASALAISQKSEEMQIKADINLARIYFYMSELEKAIGYAQSALNLSKDVNSEIMLAESYDALGTIYYDIGYHNRSSECFYNSLKLYEKSGDKSGLGATYCRIGTLHFDEKDFDKSEHYYQLSLTLAKEINSNHGIASNYNNLAKIYFEKKEYDKALRFYNSALTINQKENDVYLTAGNYLNIAEVYYEQKKYEESVLNLKNAEEIYSKIGNKVRLCKCFLLQGNIDLINGNISKSIENTLYVFKLAKEQGLTEMLASASGQLNEIYLSTGDSIKAFRYFIMEKQLNDSLLINENKKTLTKLELQYQIEKNEQELKVAKQRKNIVISIIAGCLVFSIIITFLILKQLQLRSKKQQLERESYEKELEFKNKEMVLNIMTFMKRNEMLSEISEKLMKIEKESLSEENKHTIHKIITDLKKSQEDQIWQEFALRFKEIHGSFHERLLAKYPMLTPNELKLCAFLRLNLSSKDIAELTGQRTASLETARYRLRQKLGLVNSDVNLITFLTSF